MGGRWGPSPEVPVENLRFDFACTTTNIAAASASSAAFFTVADWSTYDGFFASATTCKAGSRSLTVAFRTQYFLWHCSLPGIFCATSIAGRSRLSRHDQQPPQLAALSMDGVVNDQDYNDGTQNHHPIGKLNARYRCLFAKPFHDCSSHTRTAAHQGRNATEVRGRVLYMSNFFTDDNATTRKRTSAVFSERE
jgi:hypothetical protein